MISPKLIILEGPDGVGKSFMVQELAKQLSERGESVRCFSFPGHEPGTLGSLIYELHDGKCPAGLKSLHPVALQALHIAAQLQIIETSIKPLLNSGTTIVIDRFWWSTWAYGVVAGINKSSLDGFIAAVKASWHPYLPGLVILLERRSSLRAESDDNWTHLKTAYSDLAVQENGKYPIHRVSNDGDPAEAFRMIWQQVSD